ncbi:unnamed protein product [Protopolystoma xenopodis]|uniref:Beta-mannosidase Ig-fold domain-containing protein n=1 Tax=Protopolystoma xenopodis TaxID=117903 RepID=A0A3S5AU40_9PLAT|nr:unnamed protein product [Protopolystoma xenopodis]
MHHHLPPHTTQVNAPGRSNLVHLARWPLHPGNLQNRADWAASDDCPVHLFRASVGQMMRQCKCESVEPAACLVHVSLYGEADDYPGHDWIALGRPAEISFWPPTAGRNGLRISHVHDVGFTSTSSPAGVNGDSQPFHSSRVYELSVAAKSPELFVWLDLDPALNLDAWFSDNGFSLLAQPERNVTMYVMGNPGLSAAQLQAKLRIYSLAMLRQSGVHPAEFS